MVVYTLEQHKEILRYYFENHFGRSVCSLSCEKVKETGILIDKPKCEKAKTVCVARNIVAAAESMREAPSTSIHSRSQQFNISETTLRRILHKALGMTPYKAQLVQELKSIDHPMRSHFAKWACDRLTEDTDFGKKKSFFRAKLSHLGQFGMHPMKSRHSQNESLFDEDA